MLEKRFSWVILTCLLLWSSCQSDQKIQQPDTGDIQLDYQLTRYEQLIQLIDAQNPIEGFTRLQQDHPSFNELYFYRLVPVINPGDPKDSIESALKGFLQDDRITYLLDTVGLVFDDFEDDIIPELNQAFKNFKYYFPEWKEPNVYTLVSEYAYQHFLFQDDGGQDGIGIGLDMYLGREFPYHRIAPGVAAFSEYITRSFDKDHLVKKTMDVILDEVAGPPPGPRMLDQMIHNGKKLYIMQHLLPTTPDSIIMEYTADQMDWARQNEEEMWAFFFREELFYETDMISINKYVNTSPDSPGMPPEAPGRTGNYMGWQIIKAYMKRNPEVSFQQLTQLKDAQLIMDLSRYKPRRK